MNISEGIGAAAALLTMFGFTPQIYKMVKFRSSRDVSLLTFVQFTLGVSLWLVYGLYRNDFIIVFANIITLLSLITGIFIYFKFK